MVILNETIKDVWGEMSTLNKSFSAGNDNSQTSDGATTWHWFFWVRSKMFGISGLIFDSASYIFERLTSIFLEPGHVQA